jgi:hypothetical protein
MADRLVDRSASATPLAPAGARRALPAWRTLTLTARTRTALALGAAFAAVLAVQAPVLGHYFFGDDFVPLADIASRSTPGYVRDLFLLRDETPNWRFLTGLFYLGAYKAFGLNTLPYFLASVLVHTGSAALLFHLVRRATESDWTALLAAAFFGLSAAPVPTVGQVTAFNNVLATFLAVLAVVLLYEGLERRQLIGPWLAGGAAAFAAAIAANESVAVIAPVFGLVALWKIPDGARWWRDARAWTRVALVSAPFAALGLAALAGFAACQCTEAELWSRDDIISNVWLYLGRLLYPVGLEFPGHVERAHMVAGPVALAVTLLFIARGPALGRIAAVFLLLAIVPYLPIGFWAAGRYVYLASAPFAVLAALLFAEASRHASRAVPAATAALAVVAIGALALHGWQSWEQNRDHADASGHWRALVTGLERRYPELPRDSAVYVRGGPLTGPLWQFYVLPAVGEVVWGGVSIRTVPEDAPVVCVRHGVDARVVDYDGGRFTPVPAGAVTLIACPVDETLLQ